MLAKIQKWGNSQGIRLSKTLLADANLGQGDEVDVAAKDGLIIITPVNKNRRRLHLEDLVARIPENFQAGEVDWSEPTGKETW